MRNLYKKLVLFFTTFGLFTFVAVSQTTIALPVNANTDDAEERLSTLFSGNVGSVDAGSSDLEIIFDEGRGPQAVGMIFRNATIPKGSTITNAYVQFTVDALVPGITDVASPPLEIYGVKEAKNADTYVDGIEFDVTRRPKTTAKVTNWIPGPSVAVGNAGENERTPDLKAIIQEIVDQTAWTSGFSITIVVTGEASATVDIHREFESYEGGSSKAPVLNVTYTAGVGIEKINASNGLIYPNPAEGKFMIKNPSSGNFGYSIYNVIGSRVSTRNNISGSTTEVDMSSSAKGMYVVEVKSAGGTVKSKLFLK